MTTKVCNKCKIEKPVSEFGKEARCNHGLKPRCKQCLNEYGRNFYKNSFSPRKLQSAKDYANKNKEKIKLRESKRDREEVRRVKKAYRQKLKLTNPDYFLEKRRFQRAHSHLLTKRSNTVQILGYSYEQFIEKVKIIPDSENHVDHKIPLSWFEIGTDIKLSYHLENLHVIPKHENFTKLNSFAHPVSLEYLELIKDKIKPQYQNKLRWNN